MLELFFNKAAELNRLHRKCFPMIFVNFSTTPYFLITPQNQAKLQRKQVSKVT